MSTPEGKVKAKITKILKAHPGVYYFTPIASGYGLAGVPDIIACVKGKFLGIEVKADMKKNPPTALQAANLEKIKAAGGYALVLDNSNLRVLQDLLEELCEL
jgi:Holliday junction resolvase